MMTQHQIEEVWEGQIASEVRSLYFGDLANVYSQRKQWITGISFFFSSGAFATLLAKLPLGLPIAFSLIVALVTAYSVAVNLDSKIRTMGKLHYSWSQIGKSYSNLWNYTYREDAVAELEDLKRRELELSELATTDAPYDLERLRRWQRQVLKLRHLETA